MGREEGAEQGPGTQGSHQMPPQGWWILLPGGDVGTTQIPVSRGQQDEGPAGFNPKIGEFYKGPWNMSHSDNPKR